jgi:hypothetical protein
MKYFIILALVVLSFIAIEWARQPVGTLTVSQGYIKYEDIKCENGVKPYYLNIDITTTLKELTQSYRFSWQCGDRDRRYINFDKYSIKPWQTNGGRFWSTIKFNLGLIKN